MPGDPADGRDRRVAVADPELGQPPAGLEHGVEVHHRLAHAHEHGVVDGPGAAEVQRLVEDLRGGQVASEAHLAGGAEAAGERAARLRGQAQRAPAVAVAHQHRLHGPAVVGAHQRLDRAVAGVRLVLDGQARERHPLGERGAQLAAAGRSSRRSRRRPAPSSARPAGRGRRARRARPGSARAVAGPCALWWQPRCAWRSSWPRRASPPAAPPRRSSAPAGSRSTAEVTRSGPRRRRRATPSPSTGDRSHRSAERVVYAVNKPAGVVSTAHDPQGRPTVVSLVPSRAAPVPGRAPGHRHHRADPAHQRRRARPPAHPPALRGAQDLPGRGSGSAPVSPASGRGAARGRRARGRPDRARPGPAARVRTRSS